MGIKQAKSEIYYKAFSRNIAKAAEFEEVGTDEIKRLVFYGIKRVVSKDKPQTYDEAKLDFSTVNFVKQVIVKLTPAEFMAVFPIRKDFYGEKYDMNDYFWTRDYIEEMGLDNKIGDNVSEFLMGYHNHNVMMFIVRSFSVLSDLWRFEGKLGIMEEWADMHGVETFTMRTDANGREYVMDGNGRTSGVRKSLPSYLRVIK